MPSLPSSLSLSGWPVDGSLAVAATGRADLAAIQTAVNALIAAESGGTAGQFLSATSSTAVAWAGSYTNYTPTITGSVAGGALGNGTILSDYLQIGKLVHYQGKLNLGTTTSFGTGIIYISLPVTAANNLQVGGLTGSAYGFHAVGGLRLAMAQMVGTTNVQFTDPATFGGSVQNWSGSSSIPWTWAASDEIRWNLTYEAA